MRLLLLATLAACTINGRGPTPVTALPPPDPDRMPSSVLDHQDPGADTSKNPELSRSEANPHPWLSSMLGGCGGCEARDARGASNPALVALAVLGARRRRKPS